MNNDINSPHNNHSLTGNEFLDFLSWCESVGIDFEGKEIENDSKEETQEDEPILKITKTKGRDKYE